MVGGYVIGIEADESDEDLIVFLVREKAVSGHCRVKARKSGNSKKVAAGDTIWWQSGKILWTPAAKVIDLELEKVGYSY